MITLLTDPFQDDIREMRDYLLAGADRFRDFNAQSLCEILVFLFAIVYLVIGLADWYAGDPNGSKIDWTQMAVDGVAWIALMITWAQIKQINRDTRNVFDQSISHVPQARRLKILTRPVTKRASQSSCLVEGEIRR